MNSDVATLQLQCIIEAKDREIAQLREAFRHQVGVLLITYSMRLSSACAGPLSNRACIMA